MRYVDSITGELRLRPRYKYAFWSFVLGFAVGAVMVVTL